MSEETENDGTWSGLKKTIIGAIATAITAGGAYLTSTLLGGGEEEKSETKTEQAAPVINLNVDNSSKNTSTNANGGGTTTIIKEKTVEKPVPAQPAKKEEKSESQDAPW